MNEVAIRRTISDALAEYEAKLAAIPEVVAGYKGAIAAAEQGACVSGTFGESIFRPTPHLHERDMEEALLKSAWKHVYNGMNIAAISSATDRKRFEMAISKPPEFTLDNIRATFGAYILNPRENILRGLVEVFVTLDPAYRSHNKVKIGTAGLPKRVILRSCGSWGSWGYDRLRDVINALRALDGRPLVEPREIEDFLHIADLNRDVPEWTDGAQFDRHATVAYKGSFYRFEGYGKPEVGIPPTAEGSNWRERPNKDPDLSLRRFQNGNAHLIFNARALRAINLGLAEYYGDILPDAESDEPCKPAASTAVAKDLQYYPTPADIAGRVIGEIYIREGHRVLEPSCGCGRLMAAMPKSALTLGIEVDPDRANQARRAGFNVMTANFLEVPPPSPDALFDHVVMNPPFYGRHYLKHFRHALKFLKPGGTITAILPASAYYDHKELPEGGRWLDLPVGSFAESGTRVCTGVFSLTTSRITREAAA